MHCQKHIYFLISIQSPKSCKFLILYRFGSNTTYYLVGEINSNHSCLYLKLFQKTGKKRLRIRDESVYPPAKRLKLCEPQRSVTLSLNNNVTPWTPSLTPYSWPQLLRTHTSVPSISRTPFLLVSHSQTKFSKESPLLGVLVKPNAVNLPGSFSGCRQNPLHC